MVAAALASACANSNIINTPPGPRPETVPPPPQPQPAEGLDPHLANAFDFHVNTDTVNGAKVIDKLHAGSEALDRPAH